MDIILIIKQITLQNYESHISIHKPEQLLFAPYFLWLTCTQKTWEKKELLKCKMSWNYRQSDKTTFQPFEGCVTRVAPLEPIRCWFVVISKRSFRESATTSSWERGNTSLLRKDGCCLGRPYASASVSEDEFVCVLQNKSQWPILSFSHKHTALSQISFDVCTKLHIDFKQNYSMMPLKHIFSHPLVYVLNI